MSATSDPPFPQMALTYAEAGQSIGVSSRTVWQLVKDKRLRTCRIGRAVRIPVDELRRFLAEQAGSAQ
jgi:excisionase family DNA binding protein